MADERGTSPGGNGPLAGGETSTAIPRLVVRREASALTATGRWKTWLYRIRLLPVFWLFMVTGAFVGMYFQPPPIRFAIEKLGFKPGGGSADPIVVVVPRPQAPVPAPPPVVVGLGKLLPEGEIRTISVPYGAGDARIAEMRVREGDVVKAGDVLATLDNERTLKAAVDSARATLAARDAALEQIKAATRASRDEARAALGRAENTLQNAQREFERIEQLRRNGFAAEATYDQRRTARDDAAGEVERLKATLSRYGDHIDTQADVVLALRNRESTQAELARAEADLDKAFVRAPTAGTILSIQARPGEKPGSDGIMKLGDIERMKAEIEVYQAQIGRVAVGDAVELRAEALPERLTGTVTRIGLEVGRQTMTDVSPAANTDARVVKVTVGLDPEMSRLARRFTNLQVTARITVTSQP